VHCTQQGRGDAILFIHGMPTNHMLWDGVIQQLSKHYRCFAVDLPGMGETPFIPYRVGYLDHLAKKIELLRLEHRVKRWHVVGHDAGSAVAVQYAGRFGSRVGSLALLSPAIFPELRPFYLLSLLRKPIIGEILAPLLHFVFWKIAMRRAIGSGSGNALLRAFYEPFSGPAGAWQLMRLVRWGRPQDMFGRIPTTLLTLPMPTLLFHGMRDVLPAAFAQRAASLIPNSRMITLDAGHFIPLDRPVDVASSLSSFFAENRAANAVSMSERKPGKRRDRVRVLVADAPDLEGRAATASVPA